MAGLKKPYSDAEIIAGLSKGGRDLNDAIRFLYLSNFNSLSNYICNNNGTMQEAEDIFQEVIISFINLVRAGRFRGESAISTFLFSMNRNSWMNEIKRRQRSEIRELKYESLQARDEKIPSFYLEDRQQTKELMKLIGKLGADCKKVLVLFYFENFSMKEILNELGYESEQVVRNKKYKCLKRLQEMVFVNPNLFQQLKTFLHG